MGGCSFTQSNRTGLQSCSSRPGTSSFQREAETPQKTLHGSIITLLTLVVCQACNRHFAGPAAAASVDGGEQRAAGGGRPAAGAAACPMHLQPDCGDIGALWHPPGRRRRVAGPAAPAAPGCGHQGALPTSLPGSGVGVRSEPWDGCRLGVRAMEAPSVDLTLCLRLGSCATCPSNVAPARRPEPTGRGSRQRGRRPPPRPRLPFSQPASLRGYRWVWLCRQKPWALAQATSGSSFC